MIICFVMVGLIAFQAKEDDKEALEEEEKDNKGNEFLGIMLISVAAIT